MQGPDEPGAALTIRECINQEHDMATVKQADHMTLSEVLQLQRYNGEAAFMRDLEKRSILMRLLPWYPTSDGDLHKGVKATKLPTGAFGAYNKGIPTSSASTTAYEETIKFYELKSDVDVRFFEGRSEEQARRVRAGRDAMYARGFMQGFANEVVNCDGIDAKSVKGLIPRRDVIDSKLVYDAGGTTDGKLGSIIFIRPGEDGVNLRYPTGHGPAFKTTDMGIVPAFELDSDGRITGSFNAYETVFRVFYTIDIPDDDALIRLANIPSDTALTKTIVDQIIDIVNSLDNQGEGYFALAPQKIIGQFWKYLNDKSNIAFSKREVEHMGAPTYIFNTPFFSEEYMLDTESKVTA